MSNNKQSSVEWYSVKRDVLEIEVRLGKLSANEYAEELAKAEQQAKAMHKEEIIKAWKAQRNCLARQLLGTRTTCFTWWF